MSDPLATASTDGAPTEPPDTYPTPESALKMAGASDPSAFLDKLHECGWTLAPRAEEAAEGEDPPNANPDAKKGTPDGGVPPQFKGTKSEHRAGAIDKAFEKFGLNK